MILSDFAIKRPVAAVVLNALIIVFGVLSFFTLPLREYPDVNPPIITIDTLYPGASSEVIESRITRVIEERVSGLEGIKAIESVSEDGRSKITIEFKNSRDVDDAANDVRDRVSRVQDDLPDAADPPEISKADSNDDVIIWYNVASESLSALELTDYAERFLVDQLSVVDGVSRVRVGGARRYAMRVWLDPVRLAAHNLTVEEVEAALSRENLELPAGRFESEDKEYTIRIARQYQTPEDFQKLIVKRTESGPIRLGDVARVELGPKSDRNELRGNGKPMIGLGIVKQTQANTLEVARGAAKAIERIKRNLPSNIQIHNSYDSSIFVDIAISEVYKTLIIALLLVGLVTYCFLGRFSITLIPMVTVPIALVASFTALAFFGYSINILTLLALVLAIGLVVDDSIVVLENNYRRHEKGEPALLASYRGTRQVGFAVIVTTLSTIAVFTPIIFLDGTVGRLFSEFVTTLSAAVIFSSFAALTIVPVGTSLLLKYRQSAGSKPLVSPVLRVLERGYNRGIRWLLKAPAVAFGVFAAICLAIVGIFQLLPQEYAPREDRGAFFIFVNGPEGASYDYMRKKMLAVEDKLQFLRDEKIASRTLVRTPRSFSNDQIVNDGIVIVLLEPWGERAPAKQIMGRVQQALQQISGIQAFAMMRSGLSNRGTQRPVQFVIGGDNFTQLAEWRDIMLAKLRDNPMLQRIDYDYKENKPQYRLAIHKDAAGDAGVSIRAIGRALETLYASRQVTTYARDGEEYDVILQAVRDARQQPSDLDQIYVRSDTTGALVPLVNLVTVEELANSQQLNRYNRMRAITIEASLAPGYTLGDALGEMERLARENLPERAIIDYKGESLDYVNSTGSNTLVFLTAIVIVFLVLAAQFESFVHPFVVLLTVPAAILGALGGLWIFGNTINIFSSIALVMLVGLAGKNGILIVEFINQLRDEGNAFQEAIIEAATLRFRPILMTSISTVVGSVPLVLSAGAGSETRVTIGISILCGMFFSTLVSIFIIPVFYSVFARRTQSPGARGQQLQREHAATKAT